MPPHHETRMTQPDGVWPDDWPQVLYIDHYGNAITGLRASALDPAATVTVAGRRLPPARVFTRVAPGTAFWYENSSGLVEIAVNQGHAAQCLGLTLGASLEVE
jgi:S-adenosylmethionine hydrolase